MSIARMIAGAGYSTAWDVSAAQYARFFSVLAQENTSTGLFFKPDGASMFITGLQNNAVTRYDLSSPWDVSSAVYSSVFGTGGAAQDVSFKPDGTRMYVVSPFTGILQFDLLTPWGITSASSAGTLSIPSSDSAVFGLFFKPDGTKLYVCYQTQVSTIVQGNSMTEYSLSSPWDVSTATVSTGKPLTAGSRTRSIFFRQDGRKMYGANTSAFPVNVEEFNLSVAWNISTLAPAQTFSVASEELLPEGLFFRPDGKRMYVVGSSSDTVHEYTLVSESRAARYAAAGTYSFVVPATVTSVTASLVGASGGGASGYTITVGEKNPVTTPYFGGDGGSGATATKTFAVTPGETLTVVVGAGGAGGVNASPSVPAPGSAGTDSTVTQSAVVVARADGGSGAPGAPDGAGGLASASVGDTTANGVTGGGGAGGYGSDQSGSAGGPGLVTITW